MAMAFFPDMKRYGKIKPRLSDYDWIRETDWLKLTVEACRKRGMGVGTEISPSRPAAGGSGGKDRPWFLPG